MRLELKYVAPPGSLSAKGADWENIDPYAMEACQLPGYFVEIDPLVNHRYNRIYLKFRHKSELADPCPIIHPQEVDSNDIELISAQLRTAGFEILGQYDNDLFT